MLTFFRDNTRWLMAGFLLMFTSSFGQTYFLALSVADIRREFNLTSGEFGSIYMALTLTSALALSQVGFVLDRYQLHRVLALSVPSLALGAFLVAVAPNLACIIVGLFVLRFFGQGMMLQCAFTSLGRWFVKQRGRAVSVSALGLNAGEAALPIGFVLAAAHFGWQMAWAGIAFLLLLAILPALLALSSRERTPKEQNETGPEHAVVNWSKGQTVRDPFLYVLLLGVLPPAVISSSVFFHHETLASFRGWEADVFASSFSVYALMAVFTLLIAGPVVDRLRALRVLPFHLAPLALACFVLSAVPAEWSMFAFMGFYALTDGFSLTMFGSLWPDVYGTRHLGAIRGVLTAILAFATAIGPGVSGWLIDAGIDLQAQLHAMGLYCVAMLPIQYAATRRVARRAQLTAGPETGSQGA